MGRNFSGCVGKKGETAGVKTTSAQAVSGSAQPLRGVVCDILQADRGVQACFVDQERACSQSPSSAEISRVGKSGQVVQGRKFLVFFLRDFQVAQRQIWTGGKTDMEAHRVLSWH